LPHTEQKIKLMYMRSMYASHGKWDIYCLKDIVKCRHFVAADGDVRVVALEHVLAHDVPLDCAGVDDSALRGTGRRLDSPLVVRLGVDGEDPVLACRRFDDDQTCPLKLFEC